MVVICINTVITNKKKKHTPLIYHYRENLVGEVCFLGVHRHFFKGE